MRFLIRMFDAVMGLLLAVVTLPVILILVVVSWIVFGWPPISRTPSMGMGRRRFKLLRINTVPRGFDLRGRRLRFANFLRASGLDRLPALWNVVFGHMSFVGPPPRHTSPGRGGARTWSSAVRPGLIGAWARPG